VARDLGTVEKGKLADLAFIAGDPLTRIEDLATVQAVMKNGRLYTVAELEEPFLAALGLPAAMGSAVARQPVGVDDRVSHLTGVPGASAEG
jgi:hypothetical protein